MSQRAGRPNHRIAPIDESTLKFLQALWRMEHALERASKRMEDAIGISGPQRFALRLIALEPGIGAADLAAKLHLHPSTITGVIQRLAAGGYIVREWDAADRRRVRLRVTASGQRINRPSRGGTVEHAVRNTLAKSDVRQRNAALNVLRQFANELMKL